MAWNPAFKKRRSWDPVPSLHDKYKGKKWKQWQIFFSWAPKSQWMVTAAMKLKDACFLGIKAMTNLNCIKKQRHHFVDKCPYSQSYGFSNCHIRMWELSHIEGWVLKKWCLQTVMLEKTLESPLDCKEIQPVHPKGNQSWIFTGKTDAEDETPII